MSDFEQRLNDLDRTLFDAIPAQLDNADKVSLLAIQAAVRSLRDCYVYLEIGSHLGGSLQPHLLDRSCKYIYSIDKRPLRQADARGRAAHYPENSTSRMMDNLSRVDAVQSSKITCFDSDASSVEPAQLSGGSPSVCFVDGEHTDHAVQSDFDFCFRVMAQSGMVCFHDALIVFRGLNEIVSRLRRDGVVFKAYVLPLCIFVIEIGDFPIHRDPRILRMLTNNHTSYLPSLMAFSAYRDFYSWPPFEWARKAVRTVMGRRLS